MNGLMSAFGWIANSVAYITELVVYSIHAVWVTTVKASISFLEAIDELIPDLGIVDNALWRGLIMGGVGFFLGVGLMIFLSFITGMWGIPCVFVSIIAFGASLRFAADPEGDWSLGDAPRFGRGPGPQTPLNL